MNVLERSIARCRIRAILRRLRAAGALPGRIEIGQFGQDCIATLLDDNPEAIVSEHASTGLARTQEHAILKALAEYIERRAVRGDDGALSSSGFAAYPAIFTTANYAATNARKNAYHEAVERYVWAHWWDDPRIRHQTEEFEPTQFPELRGFSELIRDSVQIERFVQIQVTFCGPDQVKVFIVFAFMIGGGVLSGGAAGNDPDMASTRYRAFAELARHAVAYRRSLTPNAPTPFTLYDRRLVYFASGAGDHLVQTRLAAQGSKRLEIPSLAFDRQVRHEFDDIVLVHHCEFVGQPPFVGGALERLCL